MVSMMQPCTPMAMMITTMVPESCSAGMVDGWTRED